MAESADALGVRVNAAITATLDTLAELMRPLQKDAYGCAHGVYANPKLGIKEVGAATAKCFERVERAQGAVEHEMTRVQERIERCRADAMDAIQLEMRGGAGKEVDEAALERKFVAALVPCLDRTLKDLPAVVTSVKAALK